MTGRARLDHRRASAGEEAHGCSGVLGVLGRRLPERRLLAGPRRRQMWVSGLTDQMRCRPRAVPQPGGCARRLTRRRGSPRGAVDRGSCNRGSPKLMANVRGVALGLPSLLAWRAAGVPARSPRPASTANFKSVVLSVFSQRYVRAGAAWEASGSRALQRCPSRQLCQGIGAEAGRRPGSLSCCICRMAPAAPPRRPSGTIAGAEVHETPRILGRPPGLRPRRSKRCCYAQAVDKHSSLLPTTPLSWKHSYQRYKVECDDDDDSKCSSTCTTFTRPRRSDVRGRRCAPTTRVDARKSTDVTDARTTNWPAVYVLLLMPDMYLH